MSQERQSLPSPFRFAGWDLVLLLLGAVGVAAAIWLLPSVHPDSTAVYQESEEESINAADIFLVSQGYEIGGLLKSATLKRRNDLLSDLQYTLGRNTTVEFLSSENRNAVAAHYWLVQYRPPLEQGESRFLGEQGPVFEVELAQNGKLLALRNLSNRLGASAARFGTPTNRVNRSALSTVIRADTSTDAQARNALAQIADSVFQSRLSFDLTGAQTPDEEAALNALTANLPVALDSMALERLTRFQLGSTAFQNMDMVVDSISIPTMNNGRTARLRLVSERPVAGQRIQIDAGISTTGTLTRLQTTYQPAQAVEDSVSAALGATKVGLLILLAFGFIVVFFRRLAGRLLDMKAALVDAMVVGILGGLVAATTTTVLSELFIFTPVWGEILIRLVVFSIVAGAISIFVFMLAGVTDSVVRENQEGKLGTLILLRHGDFQNKPMGAGLVRGTALGGILLGLGTAALAAFDQLHLSLGDTFISDASMRPVLAGVFEGFEVAYFLTLLWVVGVSSVVRRLSKQALISVALLTVTGAFIGIGPVTFEMQPLGLLVGGVSALLIAWAWVRYDIVTVMTALLTSEILWSLNEGFLVSGSPAWIDVLLGALFVGSVLLLGFVGVTSKRTGKQVSNYVPEYVSEMAGQERVRRELEIAHQVQSFFLPRSMPDIGGLDIAGMCLSANEVGGDYYDFIELEDGRMAFILGDVSGKGIQAAFFMTLVKGIVQTLTRLNLSPADIMRRLNTLFCQNAPSGTFISVVYGEIDPKTGSFTFARAGHNPVIWYRAEKKMSEALRPKGMAIGFVAGDTFDNSIEEQSITLSQGDALVFYTDGFSEAMNRARVLYGDDRLVEKVSQIGGRSSAAILRLMTEDVHHFIEGMGRADDMTMAVIKLGA